MGFVEADDVAFFTLKWEIKGTLPVGEDISVYRPYGLNMMRGG